MKWESSLVEHLQWSDTITNRESKEQLARMIAMRVQEGEIIGAGSGSTVYLALLAIAERIRTENLHVTVIPASMEISMECVRLGIPQTTLWMCMLRREVRKMSLESLRALYMKVLSISLCLAVMEVNLTQFLSGIRERMTGLCGEIMHSRE